MIEAMCHRDTHTLSAILMAARIFGINVELRYCLSAVIISHFSVSSCRCGDRDINRKLKSPSLISFTERWTPISHGINDPYPNSVLKVHTIRCDLRLHLTLVTITNMYIYSLRLRTHCRNDLSRPIEIRRQPGL